MHQPADDDSPSLAEILTRRYLANLDSLERILMSSPTVRERTKAWADLVIAKARRES